MKTLLLLSKLSNRTIGERIPYCRVITLECHNMSTRSRRHTRTWNLRAWQRWHVISTWGRGVTKDISRLHRLSLDLRPRRRRRCIIILRRMAVHRMRRIRRVVRWVLDGLRRGNRRMRWMMWRDGLRGRRVEFGYMRRNYLRLPFL